MPEYKDGDNAAVPRATLRRAIVQYLMEPWLGSKNRFKVDGISDVESQEAQDQLNRWANKFAKDFLISQNN